MIKVKKVSKFDGFGQRVSFELIKKNISKNLNYVIELSEAKRIIKLNIPFSEVFHKCNAKEWREILQYIEDTNES